MLAATTHSKPYGKGVLSVGGGAGEESASGGKASTGRLHQVYLALGKEVTRGSAYGAHWWGLCFLLTQHTG